jgi:hypothetical protein
MTFRLEMKNRKGTSMGNAGTIAKRLVMAGTATLLYFAPVFAQSTEVQEKVAAVKQIVAENKQKLMQYQWVETTQITLKGDPKPAKQNGCVYGPDGQVEKTLLTPPQEPSGGRLKKRVVAKKTEEMQDYMQDVKGVLAMYVPPDAQRMQAAYAAGKVALNPVPGAVNLIFTDYAQPGDRMSLTFDTAAHKVRFLNVDTYMGQAKDVVTLRVQMDSLPDGTNYTQQSVLGATAKQLVVTTTNGNYQHR